MALTGPQSETELCNAALSLLGVEERLADVASDASVNARRCRLALPRGRDSLLAAYPWNFAARRARLPAMAAAPAWGFTAQFLVPPDLLRLRRVRGAGQAGKYVVEATDQGPAILCDLPAPLDILYTSRTTAVGLFDPVFTDALVARLAADLAMPVTQTRSLFETMTLLAARRLEDAQVSDAREGTPAEDLPAGSWWEARR